MFDAYLGVYNASHIYNNYWSQRLITFVSVEPTLVKFLGYWSEISYIYLKFPSMILNDCIVSLLLIPMHLLKKTKNKAGLVIVTIWKCKILTFEECSKLIKSIFFPISELQTGKDKSLVIT